MQRTSIETLDLLSCHNQVKKVSEKEVIVEYMK